MARQASSPTRDRRRRAFYEWMSWATFYAFAFPFVTMLLMFRELSALETFAASALSALVGGPCMTWVFLVLVPYTRRFPFAGALPIQVTSMLTIIALGFFLGVLTIGSVRTGVSPFDAEHLRGSAAFLFESQELRPAYAVALIVIVLMSALGQISGKLGPGVLWSWMLGRYHRPKEESRAFMFLDLKDSTPLAEKLGDLEFSALVQEFMRDVGQTLADFRGRVSHYIGDEAVIYWKPSRAFQRGNCAQFVFALHEQIGDRAPEYERRFGIAPQFKAGLHVGTVIVAEVGYGKSEIVLHGDAVNTTARIVGECTALGEDFLASAEAVAGLRESASCFAFESMGLRVLKGKSTPLELFAVRRKADS
jgi:adenylate cyclase